MEDNLHLYSEHLLLRSHKLRKRTKFYIFVPTMRLQKYFSELPDFRMNNKCLHKLSDILIIGLFTYLSNGKDYEDMVLFAKTHADFLSHYAELPNGIPSHDMFNHVFSCLPISMPRQEDIGELITNCIGIWILLSAKTLVGHVQIMHPKTSLQ